MGLKVRLRWFDKVSELIVEKEYSEDFGDDSSVLDKLNIPLEKSINNGNFDVSTEWVVILQPYFRHALDLSTYDYQVSFDYQNA